MSRGHFNHAGRIGMIGGSLPKGQTNLTKLFSILKGGSGSGNYRHAGRKGKRGGSSTTSVNFTSNIIVDSETTNEEFALSEIKSYLKNIPEHIQRESSIRSLEVFENPEDASFRIRELEPGGLEVNELARGAFNRSNGKAVVSLYYSDDQYLDVPGKESFMAAYSGRNFYHEFAHSLENKITSDEWERAWGEHGYNQDEGFADAFASYMVAKDIKAKGNSDDMDYFEKNNPITTEVFKGWGL